MNTLLKSILPHVAIANDHEKVSTLRMHFDLAGKPQKIDVHPVVPALIADHHATSVDIATKQFIAAIHESITPTTISPHASVERLLLDINKALNNVGGKCGRGCGNKVIVSLDMYDFLKEEYERRPQTFSLNISESVKEDEVIVAYSNTTGSIVDAGAFVAEYPNGDVQLCFLPHWDSYFDYLLLD
jgi:hypothetical protein